MGLDWTKLPQNLHYLIPVAEKYGRIQFDEEVHEFLFEEITQEDLNTLRSVDMKICHDWQQIEDWINVNDMGQHKESARVYFLTVLLGHLNCLSETDLQARGLA
jgi:hypothetical protein